MRSVAIDKYYKWLDYIMPVYFVVAFVEFYFGIWHLTTIVKILSILVSLVIVIKLYNVNNNNGGMKSFLTLFIVFNLTTGLAYLWNGRPIACYLNDVMNYIPAMLFMFVGMFDYRVERTFYKSFLLYCTISMAIGLLLYVTATSWFITRSMEIYNSQWFAEDQYNEDSYLNALRFSSYLASEYAVIYLGMAAFCTALFYLYSNSINTSIKRRVLYIASVIILLVAFFLSQMRVAIVYSVLLLSFYFVRGLKRQQGGASLKMLLFLTLFTVVAFMYLGASYGDRLDSLLEMVTERLSDLSIGKLAQGRDTQLSTLMSTWDYVIFGHGLGSGGSSAVSRGFPGVTDLQYIKILFETGLLGLLFFLVLVLSTLIRSIKFLRYYLIEAGIIGFVLIAMIGGNTLSLGYLYILPFWYAMGMVWNKNYLNYAKNNRIYA